MPSIQTRGDRKGCSVGVTENRAIHADQPCAAGRSGKMKDVSRQIMNRAISAAEMPDPKATILRGLLAAVCVFIAPSNQASAQNTIQLSRSGWIDRYQKAFRSRL